MARSSLLLDGRVAKTPGGRDLAPANPGGGAGASCRIGRRWRNDRSGIDAMDAHHHSAIDGVAYRLAATVDEITKYAGSDPRLTVPATRKRSCRAQPRPGIRSCVHTEKARRLFHFARRRGVIEQPEAASMAVKEAVVARRESRAGGAFALAALLVMASSPARPCLLSPWRMASSQPPRLGVLRMWTRILKCEPGARMQKPFAAAPAMARDGGGRRVLLSAGYQAAATAYARLPMPPR